jgi:hypothetical protein
VGTMIWSTGRPWHGLAFNVLWAACLLTAFALLRPFGAAGLAGAFALSHAVHLAAVALYTHTHIVPHIRSPAFAVLPQLDLDSPGRVKHAE